MDGIKRDLFPILQNKHYLNTCSVGPLAMSVKEGLTRFISEWDTQGGLSWTMKDGWTEAVEKARKSFAELIHAKPEEIAYSFGNSVAISSVTSALNLQKGDEIVFNELDFPSTASHAMGKKAMGLDYKVAKSENGITIQPEDYTEALNDNTKLVTACHVVSNTGFKLDIQELTKLAHGKGIDVFIDAYQSVGNTPIDVKKLDVDFLATGSLKWTLGGFGMSFLYIREDKVEELNPSSIGWMGVDNPFADLLDKLRLTLNRPKDAQKFQYGTAYPNGAITAYEGLKIIDSIGIDTIENQNQKLMDEILTRAKDLGFKILTPLVKNSRGSIANIQVPNAEQIVEDLKKKNFILDSRAHGIRISPHFFNNSDDIDVLFSEIASKIK